MKSAYVWAQLAAALVVTSACVRSPRLTPAALTTAPKPSALGGIGCDGLVDDLNRELLPVVESASWFDGESASARPHTASVLRGLREQQRSVRETAEYLDEVEVSDRRVDLDQLRQSTQQVSAGLARLIAAIEQEAGLNAPKVTALWHAHMEVDKLCRDDAPDARRPTVKAECKKLREVARARTSEQPGKDQLLALSLRHRPLAQARDRLVVARRNAATVSDASETSVGRDVKLLIQRWKGALSKLYETCGSKEWTPAPRTQVADWVGAKRPEHRKLTVLVSSSTAPALARAVESLGNDQAPEVAAFYRDVAAGGSGSGVLLARREPESRRVFVVTNRHVVEYAYRVSVQLPGTDGDRRTEVVYVDPRYDLAILELTKPDAVKVEQGYPIGLEPARDLQEIVAVGYPGLNGVPSYQSARGHVSNPTVWLKDELGRPLVHLQHTAPIDPGSSGGALTTLDGKLLGINTFTISERENVALAVPAAAIVDAVDAARKLPRRMRSRDWMQEGARDACLGLASELWRDEARLDVLQHYLSVDLVVERATDALLALAGNEAFAEHLRHDPLTAVREAVAWRVHEQLSAVLPFESCSDRSDDGSSIVQSRRATFNLRIGDGRQKVVFVFERGRWLLDTILPESPSGL